MNTYENATKEFLENLQISPSEALRDRVMQSVGDGEIKHRAFKRRLSIKAAIIAAVIATLVLTTAATYGSEVVNAIKQVIFGDSIGTQIDSEHELYIGSWGIMNRNNLDGAVDYPLGLFDTLEKARLAAPFYIKEPSYLPESIAGLRNVGVWRLEDPDNPWMHFVTLNYDLKGDGRLLELKQVYAGPDAYIKVETISSIGKIMVGDIEALLVSSDGHDDVINDQSYSLWWIKDGIAYELSSYQDIADLETLIAIAESIQ